MVLGGRRYVERLRADRLAVAGTFAVLLANFGLRPLARLIDRQPTESDTTTEMLLLRLVCRSEGENHARALLVQMTQTLPIACSLYIART
jgi:uncharacterized membrane protein YhiD involved in acid resistance